VIALLLKLSWPELRHHPWRNLAALVAVMLGVALAFSVHLINTSALSEFSAAVRSVNGEPDFEVRAQSGRFDEAVFERVANHRLVRMASPVVVADTFALNAANAQRVPLQVVGVDVLTLALISPALLPQPGAQADRMAAFNPSAVFLNATARARLNEPTQVQLQTPAGLQPWQVQGSVNAPGAPLAVMDIASAQAAFGMLGQLSRIDVRLVSGVDIDHITKDLALPEGVYTTTAENNAQQMSNVSRAYRVNLTMLALVALFTGAFLVFSILSLSVAKRQAQFALLGVLGLSGPERLKLVVAESVVLGFVGSVLGLALGTAMAWGALTLLSGDLGGGFFPGVTPKLQWSPWAALVYGTLGVLAAVVGGWLPAQAAQRLAPAQALKGLGVAPRQTSLWWGPAMLVGSALLALAPAIDGMPVAAYIAVAGLLIGGIVCVPAGVALLLRGIRRPRHPLVLLAVERARHQRHTATIAVAGVVASLSLAVALTVMVSSFRDAVNHWLDTVLPADLYLRASASANGSDTLTLPIQLAAQAAQVPGVVKVQAQRVTQLELSAQPLPPGEVAAYVSEAMLSLHGAALGSRLKLPLQGAPPNTTVFVRGVWRDYARQHGTIRLHSADYQRLTQDPRVNDLALWLEDPSASASVQNALRQISEQHGLQGSALEFFSSCDIRAISLRIFDRSFAVTYWLQAVAIAIGLFGIGASFSAQVLARRKEFGLLTHLGLTRGQVLTVVALEGAVWTLVGALLGLGLGLAVSVVLVKVINPISFHWTMDMLLPWGRLAALCLAVMLAGTLTAWLSARSAVSKNMALAVKEDW
jgi:putative ABC transport system permease protein